ncbi:transcriptional repressor, partial [Acidobacteria bacterium AH-259-O06]|nr:transcriptional repressor [Acidobacteria bacterium AH-259-O06]
EQLEILSEYLRKNGLKMTRQRRTVAESFLQTDGHLSTDEWYELVRKKDEKVGFTTVFRTLKTLTDCGLARETHFHDGRIRFEHIYRRPHHHHIVCVECGRTIEFLSPQWEQIQEEIVSKYGFKPLYHNLQIFGVCRDCQNKQETRKRVFDSDLVFARDALKIAIATEKRGVNFYQTAGESVSRPSTKKTFLKMLEDEKEHLNKLEKEWERLMEKDKNLLDAPIFLHFDYQALEQIFPSRKDVKKKLKGNLTEINALKLAMDMEMEAYNFFSEYAERFNDTKGRDIFLRFAAEEQEHYSLIKQAYDQLTADNTTDN